MYYDKSRIGFVWDGHVLTLREQKLHCANGARVTTELGRGESEPTDMTHM